MSFFTAGMLENMYCSIFNVTFPLVDKLNDCCLLGCFIMEMALRIMFLCYIQGDAQHLWY